MGDVTTDRLASLVDPTAFVSRTSSIGRGCVLYPHCYVGLNARLDDLVFALAGCVINHDDVIGRGTALASGAQLAGSVTVEPDCYLGQACTVPIAYYRPSQHDRDGGGRGQNVEPDPSWPETQRGGSGRTPPWREGRNDKGSTGHAEPERPRSFRAASPWDGSAVRSAFPPRSASGRG